MAGLDLCAVFEAVVHAALPDGAGESGCTGRARSPLLSGAALAEVRAARLSVRAAASERVVDVVVRRSKDLPHPVALLVYRPAAGLRPTVAPVW